MNMNMLYLIILFFITCIIVLGIYQLFKYKFYNKNKKHKIYKIPYIPISNTEKKKLLKKIKKGKFINPLRNNFSAKGFKIYYDDLIKTIPQYMSKLNSYIFLGAASDAIKTKLSMLNNDDDKVFARLYINKGDMIDWHYDNNFSNARKFTAIIPIIVDKCNTSHLKYKDSDTGKIRTVKDKMDRIYIYEGDKIHHKVTDQTQGCARLVIIVPLYENPDFSFFGKLNNLAKKILYYVFSL